MRDRGSSHDRRERRLRRYSRAVGWGRITAPIGAVALVGLIFLMGKDRGGIIDLGEIGDAASLGAGLELANPRFAGTTDDGDPFVVTAKAAVPDGSMPDQIDLDAPAGEIRMSDGITLKVAARDGRMLRSEEHLSLTGDVTLTTSSGYEARTDSVEIDLDAKTAETPGRFAAEGPMGSIEAGRLRVQRQELEQGDTTLHFEGGVKLIINPDALPE